jgi:hypothetical protein
MNKKHAPPVDEQVLKLEVLWTFMSEWHRWTLPELNFIKSTLRLCCSGGSCLIPDFGVWGWSNCPIPSIIAVWCSPLVRLSYLCLRVKWLQEFSRSIWGDYLYWMPVDANTLKKINVGIIITSMMDEVYLNSKWIYTASLADFRVLGIWGSTWWASSWREVWGFIGFYSPLLLLHLLLFSRVEYGITMYWKYSKLMVNRVFGSEVHKCDMYP